MTDFESHPVGTAARIEQLEAALTRANAATAAAYEVAARVITDRKSEMNDVKNTFSGVEKAIFAEIVSLLDVVAAAIRALATPDQTAALDRLIAEAVKPLINAADAMLDAFCVHEDSAQIATSAGMINAILSASKKGGA